MVATIGRALNELLTKANMTTQVLDLTVVTRHSAVTAATKPRADASAFGRLCLLSGVKCQRLRERQEVGAEVAEDDLTLTRDTCAYRWTLS